jgi:hypothetical protein
MLHFKPQEPDPDQKVFENAGSGFVRMLIRIPATSQAKLGCKKFFTFELSKKILLGRHCTVLLSSYLKTCFGWHQDEAYADIGKSGIPRSWFYYFFIIRIEFLKRSV